MSFYTKKDCKLLLAEFVMIIRHRDNGLDIMNIPKEN